MSNFFIRELGLSRVFKLPITEERYACLKGAVGVQVEGLYLEQKYDFVVENYLEFEQAILKCGLDQMVRDQGEWGYFENKALFNRRVMNFLTAYRSYDDGCRSHLLKIFNRDKTRVRALQNEFSKQYDSRVGYWAIPALRNYVQHQGFAVHSMSYSGRWMLNDEGEDRNRYMIDLHVIQKELELGKFNSSVREKISRMNEKVDVKFLIRDFMDGFSQAHVSNRSAVDERLSESRAELNRVRDEFMLASGYDAVRPIVAYRDGEADSMCSLGTVAEDQRKYLVKKNRRLSNLALRYVTNQISSGDVVRSDG